MTFFGAGYIELIAEELMEEPSIQQMHNGMLHASNIDVNWHPLQSYLFVEHLITVWIKEAQVVPGRVDKCVQSVLIKLRISFGPIR